MGMELDDGTSWDDDAIKGMHAGRLQQAPEQAQAPHGIPTSLQPVQPLRYSNFCEYLQDSPRAPIDSLQSTDTRKLTVTPTIARWPDGVGMLQ